MSDPCLPAEEGDDLKLVFIVEPVYNDVGVPEKMERSYIKPGSKKKGGPGAQQFCSGVGALTAVKSPPAMSIG